MKKKTVIAFHVVTAVLLVAAAILQVKTDQLRHKNDPKPLMYCKPCETDKQCPAKHFCIKHECV